MLFLLELVETCTSWRHAELRNLSTWQNCTDAESNATTTTSCGCGPKHSSSTLKKYLNANSKVNLCMEAYSTIIHEFSVKTGDKFGSTNSQHQSISGSAVAACQLDGLYPALNATTLPICRSITWRADAVRSPQFANTGT